MDARADLIRLLQKAHADERGAYQAYEGHWRSVRDPHERRTLQEIARDELEHRRRVGTLLRELGATPRSGSERWLLGIGLGLRFLCYVSAWFGTVGWYAAMYGAGWREADNVREYLSAADLACEAGLERMVPGLVELAQSEWDHEALLHERCAGHWLSRVTRAWRRPGPRPVAENTGHWRQE